MVIIFNKKHIICIILLLFIIIISPLNVFAEDTNINNNSTDYNTINSQSENNNYTIFLVSDNPGTNILDMASQDIIESKNYTNLALIVRSGDQIKEMDEGQLHSLLSDSDAFICEWVSSDVDAVLTNILNKYPELSNKKIFLILEPPTTSSSTSLKLLRYNTLNYTKIFSDTNKYTDNLLVSYFSNTLRGLNYNNVYEYITNGEGQKFNTEFNKAVLYKDLNDKDNLLNQILWALNILQGNTKYTEPTNTGTLQYGIYRERYFENIEEYKTIYFKENNTRTIGIIESTMYVSNQQLDTYYKIIE